MLNPEKPRVEKNNPIENNSTNEYGGDPRGRADIYRKVIVPGARSSSVPREAKEQKAPDTLSNEPRRRRSSLSDLSQLVEAVAPESNDIHEGESAILNHADTPSQDQAREHTQKCWEEHDLAKKDMHAIDRLIRNSRENEEFYDKKFRNAIKNRDKLDQKIENFKQNKSITLNPDSDATTQDIQFLNEWHRPWQERREELISCFDRAHKALEFINKDYNTHHSRKGE